MELFGAFVPRDESVARRVAVVLTSVATVVTIAIAVLVPSPDVGAWSHFAIAGPAVVLLGAIAIGASPMPPSWLWALWPTGGGVMIALTDLVTRDASVTAQIFFFFPVLYAGAQLRRHAAAVVTAVACLGEIVVVFAALPARLAVADASYVVAALVSVAALLCYAGERADRLIDQLRELAAVDPLTGLVTRRVLDSAASSALESAASDGGTALLIVDIDHFKRINDTHGHPAGDLVLRAVSDVLRGAGRRTDIVSRMGGDEFALLMPGCPLDVAMRTANELVARIRALEIDVAPVSMAHDPAEPHVVLVTVSVGLAHLPTHAKDVHDLYRAADLSLYAAKRTGRDRVADLDCASVRA